ncbi:hypothetical protein JV46_25400 [Solemya velum gill symbiont]|uniref:Uncharacterized protein n=1 Tax=Solemya velum gill symbiont TaxID=2340 RepID=A0A0B0H2R6_SOVGS|nr:hypothetical protein [Solemya velum gill symbiont]KHF24508.1 hypothetical protein JV46_25400 [Solemya velum gill symbiont]
MSDELRKGYITYVIECDQVMEAWKPDEDVEAFSAYKMPEIQTVE